MPIIEIITYTTSLKKEPFTDWLEDLDQKTQQIVHKRLARVRLGNFGDCKPIKGGNGVSELSIDYGPGYRIYFGRDGEAIVVLLMGGNKKSQDRDIDKAKRYWQDYKES
jgi:putative addiction module killer protein